MNTELEIKAPLLIHTEIVRPQWIDHNGHMNSAYYVLAFDEAGGALFRYFGLSNEYRQKESRGIFVGDYHIHYSREVVAGDPLKFTHLVIDYDDKKVHYWQEMFNAKEGYLAAQCEAIMLHVNLNTRKVTPFPKNILGKIRKTYEAHSVVPKPDNLGRTIKIKRARQR